MAMVAAFVLLLTACSQEAAAPAVLQASTVPDGEEPAEQATSDTSNATTESAEGGEQNAAPEADGASFGSAANGRPDWLGTRVLPTVPGGAVVTPQTTPAELQDRQFPTIDLLEPPSGNRFESTLGSVPAEVLARSTWVEGCPVAATELNYLTMSFWGFDGKPHTGEMIVNAEAAADVLSVFARLFDARFPIEEMSVVNIAALEAEPTGDGNNSTSFVCRPVTGGSSFSQHAYGLAIDINPFHNPYQRQDLILPELAVDYLDRDSGQAGLITADSVVVAAFADIGWSWGGNWNSLKDYQHFSANNR